MGNQVIRLPRNAVLEVTYQCNHRCLFCSCPWYAPEGKYPKGEELDLQAWKEVVDRLYDKGVEVFSISGGEAYLKYLSTSIYRVQRETSIRGLP